MAAVDEDERAPFHVVHKVPAGDGFYVRAKHAQLVERKPEKAISLFWASLEAGDRVDSALKDLAIVLKQQNRPQDAILAISTFRARCSESSQDSLDNVLLDLYKSSGRLDDQITLLIRKLRAFENSQTFNGKRTKTARSQGKKFQVSVEQEVARLLGNLGWAYMQQSNYKDAESVYRRALALEADINKVCNLGICLMKQGKAEEAIAVLKGASFFNNKRANSDSNTKSNKRVQELIHQASAMVMLYDYPSSVEASSRSTFPSSASLLHEGVQTHTHCKRAFDDRWVDARAPSEVNFRDACSHVDVSTEPEDTQKMSERVAAAWMLACNGGQYDEGVVVGHGCEERPGNSRNLGNHNVEEGSHMLLHAPLPNTPLSDSLWRSEMHARRRLPVFRDITVLGSAAAA